MTWKMSTRYARPAIPAIPASPEQGPAENSKNSGNSNQAVPAEVERLAALARLFPERPWTGPAYPSGPCPTCGSRRYVLPAGAPGWLCDTCGPAPVDPFDSLTVAPGSRTAGPADQGGAALPAQQSHDHARPLAEGEPPTLNYPSR